jgi:hypothetical protein
MHAIAYSFFPSPQGLAPAMPPFLSKWDIFPEVVPVPPKSLPLSPRSDSCLQFREPDRQGNQLFPVIQTFDEPGRNTA